MLYWLHDSGGRRTRGQLVALQAHLLDRVQAAVLVTDFSGTVLFANQYCQALYGLGPDELVGENARELALQPVRPELISEIAKEIFEGRNWEGEFTVTRPDGSTVEVRAIDSPVFDDAGNVSGVISLAFDVTAQVLSHETSCSTCSRSRRSSARSARRSPRSSTRPR